MAMGHVGWPGGLSLLMVIGMLVVTAACSTPSASTGGVTTSQSVDRGAADTVKTAVTMGAGTLNLHGGAKDLMDADFTYSVENWKPEVQYAVNNGTGNLTIRQPANADIKASELKNVRYSWDVALNDAVPTALSVDLGAGKSTLALGGMSLTSLDVRTGAGETTVDLSGAWSRGFATTVSGGAGTLTIRLPKDVAARVKVENGLGKVDANGLQQENGVYVNGAANSNVTLQIDVKNGVGKVNLEVAG